MSDDSTEHGPPVTPTSVTTVGQEALGRARAASSGRATAVLLGGRDRLFHQVVVALAAGQSLSEHDNPGEATLLVQHGRVALTAGGRRWELSAGEHLAIPRERHGLTALEDAVVVLTTASAGGAR